MTPTHHRLRSPVAAPVDVQTFLDGCSALTNGKAPSEVLLSARYLLGSPSSWTARARALDKHGARVNPSHATAVRWDIEGAVARACNDYGILPPFFTVLLDKAAAEYCPKYGAYGVNEVMEVYGYACALPVLDRSLALAQNYERSLGHGESRRHQMG